MKMLRIKKVKSFDKSQWRGSPLVESYQDLVDAVKARQPLIFIDTYDYETVDMMLKALLEVDGLPITGKKVLEYVNGAGIVDAETRVCDIETHGADVHKFVASFLSGRKPEGIAVLKGLPPSFDQDDALVSLLRMVAGNNMNAEVLVEEGMTSDEDRWAFEGRSQD